MLDLKLHAFRIDFRDKRLNEALSRQIDRAMSADDNPKPALCQWVLRQELRRAEVCRIVAHLRGKRLECRSGAIYRCSRDDCRVHATVHPLTENFDCGEILYGRLECGHGHA